MPMPSKIYPGYRSGKLTAEYKTDQTEKGYPVWHCKCDCGGSIEVTTRRLLSGAVKNCGCERTPNPRELDLTGQRFGKLTVLCRTEKRMDQGSVVWCCQCECGNTAEVSASRLVRGKVRSCGCLSDPPPKDYIGKVFGRLTVTGYAGKKRKTTERSAVTVTYWRCRCTCGKEIVAAQPELQNGDTQSCVCRQKDHAREALKLVDGTSVAILERNQKMRSSNTSGCTGVSRDQRTGTWMAYINFKKKRYWLGRYKDKNDAIKARKAAEEMHEDFLDWYYRTYPPVDSSDEIQ